MQTPEEQEQKRKQALVVAIDKDNDYGRKAGVQAPVIGYDEVLKATEALALADPEESDANVGFATLKIAKEEGAIPVLICGQGKNSFKDDVEILREVTLVKNKFTSSPDEKPDVILVTDGAEDESIIPVLTPHFNIIGVQRITVKQLETVETVYYIVVRYIKEILSSPETAKILLGIPGLVLLLIGISVIVSTWFPNFYQLVKNFIIGFGLLLFGGYVAKVGFKVKIDWKILKKDFVILSSYGITLLTFIVGAYRLYRVYKMNFTAYNVIMTFVQVALVTVIVYAVGMTIVDYMNDRKKTFYYLSVIASTPVIYSSVTFIVRYVLEIPTSPWFIAFNAAVIILFTIVSGILYRKYRTRKKKLKVQIVD